MPSDEKGRENERWKSSLPEAEGRVARGAETEQSSTKGERASTVDPRFVSHPMLRAGSLEERKYQIELSKIVADHNTLAVLPTGLGKTAIALLVIANFLSADPMNSCLILAPTRVLVHQHYSFLRDHLLLPQDEITVITGEDQPGLRSAMWSKRVVCSTPQVMVSDIRLKNCKIEKFSLIVFDEVHRAVGNHAYTTIGAMFSELRPGGRVLGMTASLPSDPKKVEEIVSRLKISKIESRDERDEDVRPYVFKTDVEWIELELSPELKDIQKLVKEALAFRIRLLQDAALIKGNRSSPVSLKDLLRLRQKVDQIQSSQLRNALFSGIRLQHALNLLETQSLFAFKAFMDRLSERRRGYGMSELLDDSRMKLALQRTAVALAAGTEHPKLAEVLKLCGSVKKGDRAIVFASYRDTVDQICSELVKHGIRAGYLIGKSGASGQSQKKQIMALEELKGGVYDILVATQVGEEGLDIAECNLVVFYDNVPSAVRFVQRKGRTGRKKEGRVCVFLTKGTKDEAYYWMSRRKVRDARRAGDDVRKREDSSGPMDTFLKEGGSGQSELPLVYVDTREVAHFAEALRHRGANSVVRQLEIGDFVVSADIAIERKTMDDFVKSIYDGRLFKQLANMTEKYPRPVLLIQGERKDLSGIGESAFYGALASVVSDFRVTVLFAPSERDVVEIIYHIARREQSEKNKETRIREGRKPVSLADSQRYVVAGVPGVDAVLADNLLTKLATVERVFSASEQELQSVEGIGEVTARRIRQTSTAVYIPDDSGAEATEKKDGQKDDEGGADSASTVRGYSDFWTDLAKRVREEEAKRPVERNADGAEEEEEHQLQDIPPPPSED